MVETPNGLRLTQNGSFTLNDQGTLVTKEGYPVLPATYFQNQQYITLTDNVDVRVDKSGTIYTMDKGQNAFYQQDEVGRLYIVQSDYVALLTLAFATAS